MTRLEYVASGLTHTRIALNAAQYTDISSIFHKMFSEINSHTEHDFSVLYNAHTEHNLPKFLKQYKKHFANIFSDSGGLQMITTPHGKKYGVSEKQKEEIYKNQSRNSDIAMCFDEIPISVSGEKSVIGDNSNRFFDKELMEIKARETGKNIKKQIELFHDEGSDTKPVIIIHGNDYDSFMRWTEFVLDEIPLEMQPFISGVSLSAAAHGSALWEDIYRGFVFKFLPIETSHLHLLGVGTPRRLLPFISFSRSGFYPKDMKISYDSTTHTSGVNMGYYFYNGRMRRLNRHMNKIYSIIYNDIAKRGWFDDHPTITLEEFYKIINSNSAYYIDDKKIVTKEKLINYYVVKCGYLCYSMVNFMSLIDEIFCNKRKFLSFSGTYDIEQEMKYLENIKTFKELMDWRLHTKNTIKSNPVASQKPVTLFDL